MLKYVLSVLRCVLIMILIPSKYIMSPVIEWTLFIYDLRIQ